MGVQFDLRSDEVQNRCTFAEAFTALTNGGPIILIDPE
jgi:hypothetical protein